MPVAVCFTTHMFDVANEDPNPINPIYGQSLLLWLRQHVRADLAMGEPDVEDWGWFTFINWQGRPYLIGGSSDDGRHWFLQVDNQRSFLEALLGREKMKDDDPCLSYLREILESEPEIHDVEVC